MSPGWVITVPQRTSAKYPLFPLGLQGFSPFSVLDRFGSWGVNRHGSPPGSDAERVAAQVKDAEFRPTADRQVFSCQRLLPLSPRSSRGFTSARAGKTRRSHLQRNRNAGHVFYVVPKLRRNIAVSVAPMEGQILTVVSVR